MQMDKSYILETDVRQLLSGCIFKYGKAKYVRTTLDNETLGFSSLSSFNDIYESDYRITHYFHSIEDQKKLLDGPATPFGSINDKVSAFLSSIRVSCFSYSAYNHLMWSHYADDQKGVCYCIDFSNQKYLPFEDEFISWGNVQYSTHVPELSIFQDKTTEGILRALLHNVVLSKSIDWSYEQELRFYNTQNVGFHKFKPAALRAIILGRRVKDSKIAAITRWVEDFNNRNETEVRVLFAHRVPSTYIVGVHSNKGMREGGFSARIPVCPDIDSRALTSIRSDIDESYIRDKLRKIRHKTWGPPPRIIEKE
jgi:hypothetical protein